MSPCRPSNALFTSAASRRMFLRKARDETAARQTSSSYSQVRARDKRHVRKQTWVRHSSAVKTKRKKESRPLVALCHEASAVPRLALPSDLLLHPHDRHIRSFYTFFFPSQKQKPSQKPLVSRVRHGQTPASVESGWTLLYTTKAVRFDLSNAAGLALRHSILLTYLLTYLPSSVDTSTSQQKYHQTKRRVPPLILLRLLDGAFVVPYAWPGPSSSTLGLSSASSAAQHRL